MSEKLKPIDKKSLHYFQEEVKRTIDLLNFLLETTESNTDLISSHKAASLLRFIITHIKSSIYHQQEAINLTMIEALEALDGAQNSLPDELLQKAKSLADRMVKEFMKNQKKH